MNIIKQKTLDPNPNVVEMSYDEIKQIYLVTENYESPTYIRFHWTVQETGAICMSPPFLVKSKPLDEEVKKAIEQNEIEFENFGRCQFPDRGSLPTVKDETK